jgi:hypothetical protein
LDFRLKWWPPNDRGQAAERPAVGQKNKSREVVMPFIKLDEHDRKGSSEYYIRTDLIREIDIEKDEQGKITQLVILLMNEELQNGEESQFTFKGEDAERNFAYINSFISQSQFRE